MIFFVIIRDLIVKTILIAGLLMIHYNYANYIEVSSFDKTLIAQLHRYNTAHLFLRHEKPNYLFKDRQITY